MNLGADTPPRRTWGQRGKRGLLWIFSAIVGLVALVWSAGQWDAWKQFNQDLVQFETIQIGAPMAEVRYALGEPQFVLADDPDRSNPFSKYGRIAYDVSATGRSTSMPKNTTVEHFDVWEWHQDKERIDINFDLRTKIVKVVGCYVKDPTDTTSSCRTVGSLWAGDTETELLGKLGHPDRVDYGSSGQTKTAHYDALGLDVHMEKRRVYFIRKRAPGDAGFWWWISHGRP